MAEILGCKVEPNNHILRDSNWEPNINAIPFAIGKRDA